jgi:hypothetical protein
VRRIHPAKDGALIASTLSRLKTEIGEDAFKLEDNADDG